jgi:hypothetical protein
MNYASSTDLLGMLDFETFYDENVAEVQGELTEEQQTFYADAKEFSITFRRRYEQY